MPSNHTRAVLRNTGLAALALLLGSATAVADSSSTVSLTAAPANVLLPDGQQIPMWGYKCGSSPDKARCSALNPNAGSGWSPVVITVPYDPTGTNLTINLTNNLAFPVGATTNAIPTSLVIVGQLGGGLGDAPQMTVSPTHPRAGATWPASGPPDASATGCDPTKATNATFCPPGQPGRVQSFGTEVKTGETTLLPTWSKLKPGTYLIESGTHPSIQGPMGLYGVLVVTTVADTSNPTASAYSGVTYDADVALLFSEIDPVQNAAVAAAVSTAGFSETKVWSGQPGHCGDPGAGSEFNTCYPPAVNYDPRYYLINGVSFDRTNPSASSIALLTPPTNGGGGGEEQTVAKVAVGTGRVLLRLVNAGLRMHVPAVVGRNLTLYAEDGNLLPGVPKVQSDVFMAAGKTYDVGITPAQTESSGNYYYDSATYAVYDRQLSLSTNNQRDGGMLSYLNVAGSSGSAGAAASATAGATVNPDSYFLVAGNTLTISDPAKGLIANDVGVYGVTVLTGPTGSGSTLALHADGTFTYVPGSGVVQDSFTYCANGSVTGAVCSSGKFATVMLAECTAASHCLGNSPTANDDEYVSNISTALHIGSPGVLQNDTDPSGLPLTVDLANVTPGTGLTLSMNKDGSFVAAVGGAGDYTFTYRAKNSQGTSSTNAANPLTKVTLHFLAPTGLGIQVVDAKNHKPITDYRWIIEEDRTFWIDPKCQINTGGAGTQPAGCPYPVQSLGYNFHTANMPVVATGCVGKVSCEQGQTILGNTAVACDLGNGQCDTTRDQKVEVKPDQVHLDPAKRYYISVMAGDGVNPVLTGAGGSPDGIRKFDITTDCGEYAQDAASWVPGGPFGDGVFGCGHMMGGAQISTDQVAGGTSTHISIPLQETPAPTAKVTAFVFEDDNPLNGENDAGGGVDILAPNEPGLGGFEIKLFDQAGGLGDNTGQITYDMFNQPVSNALAGKIDAATGFDACPISQKKDPTTGLSDHLVGMIPTCPTLESDGSTLSPLAGQVVVENLYPGLYEIQAFPAADRIARGEEWLQTNTLDGGKPHEAFLKNDEPAYFQEFGPGGFHVVIGFANPQIINNRRSNSKATGICDKGANGGNLTCTATLSGHVTNAHMSRTPDQRLLSSANYASYSFTQCYVSLGSADEPDFAFAKCDQNGNFTLQNIPTGDFKLTVFDQWNDIMLDGLVSPVKVTGGTNSVEFPVTQWRTNILTRTFLDTNGDGVSQADSEAGLPLVATNIRYRDGSIGFFNNTDLDGYAGFNEVFPFMNWLVLETDTTRYKVTGVHTVNDTGGPVDGHGGGSSNIADSVANTTELNSIPVNLRVPGAVYCEDADCSTRSIKKGPYYTKDRADSGPADGQSVSSGRIDPPGTTTEGWQGLLGQTDYVEFGVKPFVPGENGGIRGHVIYASTRPFDDPSLLLQLSWEPGVPNVKVNLYREGTAADGTTSLKLVDTTMSSSWDAYAQGFRSDGIPNMNCPGQDSGSPFFATLQDSTQWLDPSNPKKALPNKAQFKCYDGWSQLNQVQPAPYDGMYRFPSVTAVNPVSGRPAATNCDPTVCIANPDPDDGNPMLPPGRYVVEVIVPSGFELVKEEDKNILLGDTYIAPVTQQFAGFGNVFIMPDQAAVNAYYNKNNPLNMTQHLGSTTYARHEGDTGTIESYWPCVGAERIVPDYNSLFPTAGQNAPFAGATRRLCDRKEITLEDQSAALAKFYIFTPTHVAGHFTGTITNDFASEFDPFSPQFGEKFAPPNLPVALRDYTGNEMGRVYSDQWGIYNGLNYSTFSVNPPNPTGYIPQMMIACMNDPGPIPGPNGPVTDPNYNPAYSNFCYEQPFMPGFTAYLDTPVIPTQAFADGYNLPDTEYPDGTPAISKVVSDSVQGPWVPATGPVIAVTLTNGGTGYTGAPGVAFNPADANGAGAGGTASMSVRQVTVTKDGAGSYGFNQTPTVTFELPLCTINTTTCVRATGTAQMSGNNANRRVNSVRINNAGAGYVTVPGITFSSGSATAKVSGLNLLGVTLTAGGAGYDAPPNVVLTGGGASVAGTAAASISLTASGTLTLSALGDKVVLNPAFTGPNATLPPYNQKTITRHYGFGAQGASSAVTIGGIN
ncbi:MAG: hypothetical protein JWO52_5260, partial [Gammaproteobacteria bacterium]|nr:hypothetical protein [Gammaproteobacteria bacterium]